MAILKHLSNGQISVFRMQHTIGRDPSLAHLCISDSDISRQHAQISWQAPHWRLRDISTNGIWHNEQRVNIAESLILSVGDRLRFGLHSHNTWEVIDLSAPTSCLIPTDDQHAPILLSDNSFKKSKEHKFDYEFIDHHRCFLKIDNEYREYKQGDSIEYLGSNWQLLIVPPEQVAATALIRILNVDSIEWQFNCSQNEEHINLTGYIEDGTTQDFGERVHHYLLLILARQRQFDAQQGFAEANQGWVDMQTLCTMMGLSETHINIQIFRARKQLQQLITKNSKPIDFIERRSGEIRFCCRKFSIYRGNILESGIPTNKNKHNNNIYSI